MLLVLKSLVAAYVRGGRMVAGYNNKRTAHATADDRQGDLFAGAPAAAKPEPRIALPAHPPADVLPEGHTRKHYVTMVREPGTAAQKVGWLAGPFDTNEEAKGHVEAARKKAHEVDPFSEFDAFGTSSRVAATHRPGVLNDHLGIGGKSQPAPAEEIGGTVKLTPRVADALRVELEEGFSDDADPGRVALRAALKPDRLDLPKDAAKYRAIIALLNELSNTADAKYHEGGRDPDDLKDARAFSELRTRVLRMG